MGDRVFECFVEEMFLVLRLVVGNSCLFMELVISRREWCGLFCGDEIIDSGFGEFDEQVVGVSIV